MQWQRGEPKKDSGWIEKNDWKRKASMTLMNRYKYENFKVVSYPGTDKRGITFCGGRMDVVYFSFKSCVQGEQQM
jgi:hypothetical protein